MWMCGVYRAVFVCMAAGVSGLLIPRVVLWSLKVQPSKVIKCVGETGVTAHRPGRRSGVCSLPRSYEPQHAEEGAECVLGLGHSYCAARDEPAGASESPLRRSAAWSDGSLAVRQRADRLAGAPGYFLFS